jgi:hypothetical protein
MPYTQKFSNRGKKTWHCPTPLATTEGYLEYFIELVAVSG